MARSVDDSIALLRTSNANIRTALSNKGVSVPSTIKFSDVPANIRKINQTPPNKLCSGINFSTRVTDRFDITTITQILFTNQTVQSYGTLDVSEKNDNSVVAWLKNNILYVSARDGGVIYANEDCSLMFNCYAYQKPNFDGQKLTYIDISYLDCSLVQNAKGMFQNASSVTQIVGLDKEVFPNLTNANTMFSSCGRVSYFKLQNFNPIALKNMASMFANCYGASYIDIRNLNTSSVTDASNMFNGCSGCSKIYAKDWTGNSTIVNNADVFYLCKLLPNYNVNNIKGNMAKPRSKGGYFEDL